MQNLQQQSSNLEIDFDDGGSEEGMQQQPENFLAPPGSKTKQQREVERLQVNMEPTLVLLPEIHSLDHVYSDRIGGNRTGRFKPSEKALSESAMYTRAR